jgi:hypothetical protein
MRTALPSELPQIHDLEGFLVWLFVGAPQVAAWATLLSMVVLYYYTRYTRRMMLATESTMRAAQRPLIQVLYVERTDDRVVLTIRNSGQGPALNLSRWVGRRSTTPNAIPRRPGYQAPSNYREEHSFLEVLASKSQEELEFQHRIADGKDWEEVLLVIHAEDISGNRYQNAVKLRLSNEEDRVVWQSLSEQLEDEEQDESPLWQKIMRAKTSIQSKIKAKE